MQTIVGHSPFEVNAEMNWTPDKRPLATEGLNQVPHSLLSFKSSDLAKGFCQRSAPTGVTGFGWGYACRAGTSRPLAATRILVKPDISTLGPDVHANVER